MPYLIFRPTRSEVRERNLNPARLPRRYQGTMSGVARNVEEAVEISRKYLVPTEAGFDKPILIQGGPEREQAFIDDMKRIGADPERVRDQWEKSGVHLRDADGKVRPDKKVV